MNESNIQYWKQLFTIPLSDLSFLSFLCLKQTKAAHILLQCFFAALLHHKYGCPLPCPFCAQSVTWKCQYSARTSKHKIASKYQARACSTSKSCSRNSKASCSYYTYSHTVNTHTCLDFGNRHSSKRLENIIKH